MQVPPRRSPGMAATPRSRRRLLTALAAGGIAVGLAGCNVPSFGSYRGSTTQAKDTFNLWAGFNIGAIIVGVIVWGLIFWAVIRYRRRDDSIPRQTQYNHRWEIIYTVTPILAVAVLFAFTVLVENKVDKVSSRPDVNVTVTAFQWGWRFDYPASHITVVGDYNHAPTMVLPAGKTVKVTLVSNDVIHGFYVPKFNFSRYAQPGVRNVFDLDIVHPGVYPGRCTQYCGLYHTQMKFDVRAVSPTAFQSWETSQQPTKAAA